MTKILISRLLTIYQIGYKLDRYTELLKVHDKTIGAFISIVTRNSNDFIRKFVYPEIKITLE